MTAVATAARSVLFVGVGDDGCGWYRGVQPVRALAAAGVRARISRTIRRTYKGDETVMLRHDNGDAPLDADTIVMQRPMPPEMPSIARCAVREGRRLVVEMDDDVWSMAPHNPAARHFNRATLATLAECCRLAHCVIVSTAPLAARVRAITGQQNIVVIPNAVDPSLAGPPRAETPPLIVGWAGGASHRADFRVARDAVLLAQQTPGWRVHFHGDDPLCGPPPTPGPRRILGWTADMAEHYRNIAAFHIGLAPVENSRFNRSKSALKWMEYALHAVPALVSDVQAYSDFVTHGTTGLLAGNRHDWERQLVRLMRDCRMRQEIGNAAREVILSEHLIAHRAALYRQVLEC